MKTSLWPIALVGLALAASVVGCSSAPAALPCPGQPVGTFKFHGVRQDGGCPFKPENNASKATFDFNGTITTVDQDTALLCRDVAEAAPLAGTLQGDVLSVTGPTPLVAAQTVPDCNCAVTVIETITGNLVRGDGGVTGFAGALNAAVDPGLGVAPASCERAPPTCGVPCVQTWTITAIAP